MYHQLYSVVYSLSILANDPNHGSPRFSVVKRLQMETEIFDDVLIPIGVLTENVLYYDDDLLYDELAC